jgi:hypothetical protein
MAKFRVGQEVLYFNGVALVPAYISSRTQFEAAETVYDIHPVDLDPTELIRNVGEGELQAIDETIAPESTVAKGEQPAPRPGRRALPGTAANPLPPTGKFPRAKKAKTQ